MIRPVNFLFLLSALLLFSGGYVYGYSGNWTDSGGIYTSDLHCCGVASSRYEHIENTNDTITFTDITISGKLTNTNPGVSVDFVGTTVLSKPVHNISIGVWAINQNGTFDSNAAASGVTFIVSEAEPACGIVQSGYCIVRLDFVDTAGWDCGVDRHMYLFDCFVSEPVGAWSFVDIEFHVTNSDRKVAVIGYIDSGRFYMGAQCTADGDYPLPTTSACTSNSASESQVRSDSFTKSQSPSRTDSNSASQSSSMSTSEELQCYNSLSLQRTEGGVLMPDNFFCDGSYPNVYTAYGTGATLLGLSLPYDSGTTINTGSKIVLDIASTDPLVGINLRFRSNVTCDSGAVNVSLSFYTVVTSTPSSCYVMQPFRRYTITFTGIVSFPLTRSELVVYVPDLPSGAVFAIKKISMSYGSGPVVFSHTAASCATVREPSCQPTCMSCGYGPGYNDYPSKFYATPVIFDTGLDQTDSPPRAMRMLVDSDRLNSNLNGYIPDSQEVLPLEYIAPDNYPVAENVALSRSLEYGCGMYTQINKCTGNLQLVIRPNINMTTEFGKKRKGFTSSQFVKGFACKGYASIKNAVNVDTIVFATTPNVNVTVNVVSGFHATWRAEFKMVAHDGVFCNHPICIPQDVYGLEFRTPVESILGGLTIECDLVTEFDSDAPSPLPTAHYALFDGKNYCQTSEKQANVTETVPIPSPTSPENDATVRKRQFHYALSRDCVSATLCSSDGWRFNQPYNYTADYHQSAFVFPGGPVPTSDVGSQMVDFALKLDFSTFARLFISETFGFGRTLAMSIVYSATQTVRSVDAFTIELRYYEKTLCRNTICNVTDNFRFQDNFLGQYLNQSFVENGWVVFAEMTGCFESLVDNPALLADQEIISNYEIVVHINTSSVRSSSTDPEFGVADTLRLYGVQLLQYDKKIVDLYDYTDSRTFSPPRDSTATCLVNTFAAECGCNVEYSTEPYVSGIGKYSRGTTFTYIDDAPNCPVAVDLGTSSGEFEPYIGFSAVIDPLFYGDFDDPSLLSPVKLLTQMVVDDTCELMESKIKISLLYAPFCDTQIPVAYGYCGPVKRGLAAECDDPRYNRENSAFFACVIDMSTYNLPVTLTPDMLDAHPPIVAFNDIPGDCRITVYSLTMEFSYNDTFIPPIELFDSLANVCGNIPEATCRCKGCAFDFFDDAGVADDDGPVSYRISPLLLYNPTSTKRSSIQITAVSDQYLNMFVGDEIVVGQYTNNTYGASQDRVAALYSEDNDCRVNIFVKNCSANSQVWLDLSVHDSTLAAISDESSDIPPRPKTCENCAFITTCHVLTQAGYELVPLTSHMTIELGGTTGGQSEWRVGLYADSVLGMNSQITLTPRLHGFELVRPLSGPDAGIVFSCDMSQYGTKPFEDNNLLMGGKYCAVGSRVGTDDVDSVDLALSQSNAYVDSDAYFTGFIVPECPSKKLCPSDGWAIQQSYEHTMDYVGHAYVFPKGINPSHPEGRVAGEAVFSVNMQLDMTNPAIRKVADALYSNGNYTGIGTIDIYASTGQRFYKEHSRALTADMVNVTLGVCGKVICSPVFVRTTRNWDVLGFGPDIIFDQELTHRNDPYTKGLRNHHRIHVDLDSCIMSLNNSQREDFFAFGTINVDITMPQIEEDYSILNNLELHDLITGIHTTLLLHAVRVSRDNFTGPTPDDSEYDEGLINNEYDYVIQDDPYYKIHTDVDSHWPRQLPKNIRGDQHIQTVLFRADSTCYQRQPYLCNDNKPCPKVLEMDTPEVVAATLVSAKAENHPNSTMYDDVDVDSTAFNLALTVFRDTVINAFAAKPYNHTDRITWDIVDSLLRYGNGFVARVKAEETNKRRGGGDDFVVGTTNDDLYGYEITLISFDEKLVKRTLQHDQVFFMPPFVAGVYVKATDYDAHIFGVGVGITFSVDPITYEIGPYSRVYGLFDMDYYGIALDLPNVDGDLISANPKMRPGASFDLSIDHSVVLVPSGKVPGPLYIDATLSTGPNSLLAMENLVPDPLTFHTSKMIPFGSVYPVPVEYGVSVNNAGLNFRMGDGIPDTGMLGALSISPSVEACYAETGTLEHGLFVINDNYEPGRRRAGFEADLRARFRFVFYECDSGCRHSNMTHRLVSHPQFNAADYVPDSFNPSTNDRDIFKINQPSPAPYSWSVLNTSNILDSSGHFVGGYYGTNVGTAAIGNVDHDKCAAILTDDFPAAFASYVDSISAGAAPVIPDKIELGLDMRDMTQNATIYGAMCVSVFAINNTVQNEYYPQLESLFLISGIFSGHFNLLSQNGTLLLNATHSVVDLPTVVIFPSTSSTFIVTPTKNRIRQRDTMILRPEISDPTLVELFASLNTDPVTDPAPHDFLRTRVELCVPNAFKDPVIEITESASSSMSQSESASNIQTTSNSPTPVCPADPISDPSLIGICTPDICQHDCVEKFLGNNFPCMCGETLQTWDRCGVCGGSGHSCQDTCCARVVPFGGPSDGSTTLLCESEVSGLANVTLDADYSIRSIKTAGVLQAIDTPPLIGIKLGELSCDFSNIDSLVKLTMVSVPSSPPDLHFHGVVMCGVDDKSDNSAGDTYEKSVPVTPYVFDMTYHALLSNISLHPLKWSYNEAAPFEVSTVNCGWLNSTIDPLDANYICAKGNSNGKSLFFGEGQVSQWNEADLSVGGFGWLQRMNCEEKCDYCNFNPDVNTVAQVDRCSCGDFFFVVEDACDHPTQSLSESESPIETISESLSACPAEPSPPNETENTHEVMMAYYGSNYECICSAMQWNNCGECVAETGDYAANPDTSCQCGECHLLDNSGVCDEYVPVDGKPCPYSTDCESQYMHTTFPLLSGSYSLRNHWGWVKNKTLAWKFPKRHQPPGSGLVIGNIVLDFSYPKASMKLFLDSAANTVNIQGYAWGGYDASNKKDYKLGDSWELDYDLTPVREQPWFVNLTYRLNVSNTGVVTGATNQTSLVNCGTVYPITNPIDTITLCAVGDENGLEFDIQPNFSGELSNLISVYGKLARKESECDLTCDRRGFKQATCGPASLIAVVEERCIPQTKSEVESNSQINSMSMSMSMSMSDSQSSSSSDSRSMSRSQSPSVSDSRSLSRSMSDSQSPSVSDSQSMSRSMSRSQSPSVSDSRSMSRSTSPSVSDSRSLSRSMSESQSPSVSDSISVSISDSRSMSRSQSPSVSDSRSSSRSMSGSQSPSGSDSRSRSSSNSQSMSRSMSRSQSPSVSDSRSLSMSDTQSPIESTSESRSMSASITESRSQSPGLSEENQPCCERVDEYAQEQPINSCTLPIPPVLFGFNPVCYATVCTNTTKFYQLYGDTSYRKVMGVRYRSFAKDNGERQVYLGVPGLDTAGANRVAAGSSDCSWTNTNQFNFFYRGNATRGNIGALSSTCSSPSNSIRYPSSANSNVFPQVDAVYPSASMNVTRWNTIFLKVLLEYTTGSATGVVNVTNLTVIFKGNPPILLGSFSTSVTSTKPTSLLNLTFWSPSSFDFSNDWNITGSIRVTNRNVLSNNGDKNMVEIDIGHSIGITANCEQQPVACPTFSQTKSESGTQSGTQSQSMTTSNTNSHSKSESNTKTTSQTNAKTASQSSENTFSNSKPDTVSQSESKVNSQSDSESSSRSNSQSDSESNSRSNSQSDSKSNSRSNSQSDSQSKSHSQSKSRSQSDSQSMSSSESNSGLPSQEVAGADTFSFSMSQSESNSDVPTASKTQSESYTYSSASASAQPSLTPFAGFNLYTCNHVESPATLLPGGIYQVRDHFVKNYPSNQGDWFQAFRRLGIRMGLVWLTFTDPGTSVRFIYTPGSGMVQLKGRAYGRITSDVCQFNNYVIQNMQTAYYQFELNITLGMNVVHNLVRQPLGPGGIPFFVSETDSSNQTFAVSESGVNRGVFYLESDPTNRVDFGLADIDSTFLTADLDPIISALDPVQFMMISGQGTDIGYDGWTGLFHLQHNCLADSSKNDSSKLSYYICNYNFPPSTQRRTSFASQYGYGWGMFVVEGVCNDCEPAPTPGLCAEHGIHHTHESNSMSQTPTESHPNSQSVTLPGDSVGVWGDGDDNFAAPPMCASFDPSSTNQDDVYEANGVVPTSLVVDTNIVDEDNINIVSGRIVRATFPPTIHNDPAITYEFTDIVLNPADANFVNDYYASFNSSVIKGGKRFVQFGLDTLVLRTGLYVEIQWYYKRDDIDADYDSDNIANITTFPGNFITLLYAEDEEKDTPIQCGGAGLSFVSCYIPFPPYNSPLHIGYGTEPNYQLKHTAQLRGVRITQLIACNPSFMYNDAPNPNCNELDTCFIAPLLKFGTLATAAARDGAGTNSAYGTTGYNRNIVTEGLALALYGDKSRQKDQSQEMGQEEYTNDQELKRNNKNMTPLFIITGMMVTGLFLATVLFLSYKKYQTHVKTVKELQKINASTALLFTAFEESVEEQQNQYHGSE